MTENSFTWFFSNGKELKKLKEYKTDTLENINFIKSKKILKKLTDNFIAINAKTCIG